MSLVTKDPFSGAEPEADEIGEVEINPADLRMPSRVLLTIASSADSMIAGSQYGASGTSGGRSAPE